MPVNNEENREKKVNFDEKGKFCKGNTISKGKRKRTDTQRLRLALERAGKKQTPPIKWWDKVAEKAFIDKDIMKAVVNKLVPNINEITGAGGEPLSITLKELIYGKDEEEGEKDKSGEAKI